MPASDVDAGYPHVWLSTQSGSVQCWVRSPSQRSGTPNAGHDAPTADHHASHAARSGWNEYIASEA